VYVAKTVSPGACWTTPLPRHWRRQDWWVGGSLETLLTSVNIAKLSNSSRKDMKPKKRLL